MSLITDQQIQQFHEKGYFVTGPMFGPDQLDRFAREAERLEQDFIRQISEKGDAKDIENAKYRPFIGQAHSKSDFLAEWVKAPVYLEACARLIGPDADLYYNQIVTKPPEKGRYFGWHQDSGYVLTEPLDYITCWTAISRTFIENGCIWIIPGSHKWGLQEHVYSEEFREYQVKVDETDAIPVEMQPGQVAIFSSLLLHKSGANVSKEIRRGYVPQYHVPAVYWPHIKGPGGDQFPVLRNGKRWDGEPNGRDTLSH